jgi:CubicO group peptidase (beta-lactamase class C family)
MVTSPISWSLRKVVSFGRAVTGACTLAALCCLPLSARSASAQSNLDAVDRYVRAELVRQRIPGLSVAILRGDSLLLARGYGEANVELHVPASDSTIYQSGSIGKQFTSALVVMLAEEGRLGLDDSITRWFPEAREHWKGITVRHLLTHTSGIPDYADSTLDYRRDYSEDDLLHLAVGLPLAFPPGTRWSYSNTGYVLLGIIIHRVTSTFYGDLLRERIFRLLGMRTARIISEADIVPNRAAGYRLERDTLKNQEWVAPLLNTTADGSLYLTVRDLALWAVALNHRRVPSPAGLDASWQPVRLAGGGVYPYGFGWGLLPQRGYRRIGHTGSWQGFQTSIQRYPGFDLTVIVLANLAQSRPEAISVAIAGILEPALTPPQRLTSPPGHDAPRDPIPSLLSWIAAESHVDRLTPGLRGFSSIATRAELGRVLQGTADWSFIGCDRPRDAFDYLDSKVAFICYEKRSGKKSGTLVTVYYDAAWRAAGVELDAF